MVKENKRQNLLKSPQF